VLLCYIKESLKNSRSVLCDVLRIFRKIDIFLLKSVEY
jgi:hypothetical protein